jgi:hypothetical protein
MGEDGSVSTVNGNGSAAVDLGVVRDRQRTREALGDVKIGTPEFGLKIALPHTGGPPSFTDVIAATASLLSDDGWELTEVKTCHHVGSTPEGAIFQVVVAVRRA